MVFSGSGSGAVQVFETAETGAQFYGRRNFPTFPVDDNSVTFYFHRNTLTGELSLGLIVDDRSDGSGGRFDGTITGLGNSAFIGFSDDNGELRMTSPGVATFRYRFAGCCTDGGIIGGLDATNLNFAINVTRSTGLTGTFLAGPNGITQIAGAPTAGSTFFVAANPEPAAWALFIMGFAGCAAMMKRRRRFILGSEHQQTALAAPA